MALSRLRLIDLTNHVATNLAVAKTEELRESIVCRTRPRIVSEFPPQIIRHKVGVLIDVSRSPGDLQPWIHEDKNRAVLVKVL